MLESLRNSHGCCLRKHSLFLGGCECVFDPCGCLSQGVWLAIQVSTDRTDPGALAAAAQMFRAVRRKPPNPAFDVRKMRLEDRLKITS